MLRKKQEAVQESRRVFLLLCLLLFCWVLLFWLTTEKRKFVWRIICSETLPCFVAGQATDSCFCFLQRKDFYGYLGPPPRLPYCDLKKGEDFYFYGYLGPPPRLPYCGWFQEKSWFLLLRLPWTPSKIAVLWFEEKGWFLLLRLAWTPSKIAVFRFWREKKGKGFYGGTLPTSCAVRVFKERFLRRYATHELRRTCFQRKEEFLRWYTQTTPYVFSDKGSSYGC